MPSPAAFRVSGVRVGAGAIVPRSLAPARSALASGLAAGFTAAGRAGGVRAAAAGPTLAGAAFAGRLKTGADLAGTTPGPFTTPGLAVAATTGLPWLMLA